MISNDLEELQRAFAMKQLFNLTLTQSYMGLLPMDLYIETYIEFKGEKNENISKPKKI